MEETIEEMKAAAIMEKVVIPKVLLETGKEINPCIIITLEKKKIGIYTNKVQLYRILNKKNQIEGTLDIALVDTIKELLKNLAEREEATEKMNQEEVKNERKFRKQDGTSDNDKSSGRGRTKAGDSFV